MRYLALATDYDGTLAHNGRVDDLTIAALERLRASGRRLIMVTGRVLPELLGTFSRLDLFDRVVYENGAMLLEPATDRHRILAEPPPVEFARNLIAREVGPLSCGEVIVATWQPFETVVLETIREMGLEMQVIFNKGAVMILPSGVNKATGLAVALEELGLTAESCVAAGDAENDHAFFALCGFSVAVANALPAVKERADHITLGDHGAGVTEIIDQLVADDLAALAPRINR